MVKKNLIALPFIMGVGFMVLVAVVAAAVAVAFPCNGTVPLDEQIERVVCSVDFYKGGWPLCAATRARDCPDIGIDYVSNREPSATTKRYWSAGVTSKSAEFWVTFADVGGSVLCFTAYHCSWEEVSGIWLCRQLDQVRDEDGNPHEYHKDYYISVGCDIVT